MGVFGYVAYSSMKSKIGECLKGYANPEFYASSIVKDVMDEAIGESHPQDHGAFVEAHKGELHAMKQKLISEYSGPR